MFSKLCYTYLLWSNRNLSTNYYFFNCSSFKKLVKLFMIFSCIFLLLSSFWLAVWRICLIFYFCYLVKSDLYFLGFILLLVRLMSFRAFFSSYYWCYRSSSYFWVLYLLSLIRSIIFFRFSSSSPIDIDWIVFFLNSSFYWDIVNLPYSIYWQIFFVISWGWIGILGGASSKN